MFKKNKEIILEIEVFDVYENMKIVKKFSIFDINDLLLIIEEKIKIVGYLGKVFKLLFIISVVIFILVIKIMMIVSNNIIYGKLMLFY